MNHRSTYLVVATAVLLLAVPVHASLIVDTGTPPPSDPLTVDQFATGQEIIVLGVKIIGSWLLGDDGSSTQSLAGQFTFSSRTLITDLQGFIGVAIPGDIDFVLYGDAGTFPNVADELFRQTLFLDPITTLADWTGPSGLNEVLDAGTYWVAFEYVSGSAFKGAMPNGVPNPLDDYSWAKIPSFTSSYKEGPTFIDPTNFGVRVFGDEMPVPEPATVLIFTMGLGFVAARARKHS